MKPIYSSRRDFWLLAGPMIISNISIALLGLVDTAVIGHLDTAIYLSSVAIGSVIFDFLYWGMGFLRMGTTGIVAQAHGKEDASEFRTVLIQSCLVAFSISLLILFFRSSIIELGLTLLGGDNQLKYYADIYCHWMILGMPASMMLFSVNGWLLGMQNAMATLTLAIIINLINIILDIIFVIILGMDVRGVALATVISQYSGILLALFIIRKQLKKNPGMWLRKMIFDVDKLKRFITLNYDIFIRTICLIFVFAFFTREGAKQGDLVLAANSILMKFYILMALSLDGLNHAVETLVGKAVGARSQYLFNIAIKLALKWSLVFCMIFTLFYFLLGTNLIAILTDIDSIRYLAEIYLPWMIALPILSIWCFLLDGIFIGATHGLAMRNAMLICTFACFLPTWYVFQFLGNHGLWLAFCVFITARGIVLGIYYYQIENTKGFINMH